MGGAPAMLCRLNTETVDALFSSRLHAMMWRLLQALYPLDDFVCWNNGQFLAP